MLNVYFFALYNLSWRSFHVVKRCVDTVNEGSSIVWVESYLININWRNFSVSVLNNDAWTHTYIYTHAHIHTHSIHTTDTHIHTCTHMHAYTYTHIYTHTHIYTQTHTHTTLVSKQSCAWNEFFIDFLR
jgi:hypothetical protein